MIIEKIDHLQAVATVKQYLIDLQKQLCLMLEVEEGAVKFFNDAWEYKEGDGGGNTCVLAEGVVIEKAGVNFSHVRGKTLPPSATVRRPELVNTGFQALGISSVIHPLNPYVPTAHMNVRFFIADNDQWWFGGGFDLTPYYGFAMDCEHWHQMAKKACDPFGPNVYPQFKKACDEYFYLKHRQEPRGIGGIFFDDLNEWGFADSFAFIKSVGDHFIKAYQPILAARKHASYTEQERNFQLYRRGRYVEFNLLYDRGTLFGLQSGGRTESILMSLPPVVSWEYNRELKDEEAKLTKEFLIAKNWIT